MTMLLLALVLAALITGVVLWRRPDARVVAAGAWNAGKAQAAIEFRQGYQATRDAYDQAQKALRGRGTKRARVLSGLLELLGVTVVTAGGAVYGAAKTLGATRRVLIEAARGGRAAYETLEVEAIEIEKADAADADVVYDDTTYVVPPAEGGTAKLITNSIIIATTECERCGADHSVMLQPGKDKTVAMCRCGQEIHISRAAPHTQAEPLAETDTNTGAAQAPNSGGTDMSVSQEATGLTSYSLAHQQIAAQLNDLVNTSNALVASMGDLLAQHSILVGNAAVLQDLMRQASSVADRIATDAAAAATA
ncbi:hypothetical protein GBF35_26100 [Nonomuraea phyllanthi]|uniref:hypothetical protein n=1 Tax=Nonomuraea phyllanthi TaxID=2219224 RepID=UPI001293FAD2|nr:hypothetical protein [Nonomuraea phyllanthi]QFY09667.1 hypothetical protein GBF35_26100 [Nonomuraea phyllanthi]